MRGNTVFDSYGDWANWLHKLEQETMDSFLAKPVTAFSQFSQEKETAKGYHGREILELLQNAADQATLAHVNGSVHIELTEGHLVVANNGKPFSAEGVLSIENPHLSAKKSSRLVGNKGLGFRSILNWSRHPLIISGSLILAYAQSKLTEIEAQLVAKSDKYAEELNAHFPKRNGPKLPLLPFPSFPDEFGNIQLNSFDQELVLLCKSLRDKGFETVIAMPFDQPNAFATATAQLNRLDPEILLFVEGLRKLKIVTPDTSRILEERKYKGIITLLENSKHVSKWRLFKKEDSLPREFNKKDEPASSHCELMVAAPLDYFEYSESSTLYSYFSTKVKLPIRLRCHATLELDQNRNYPVESGQNIYVLHQLATFIGEVTELCAQQEWGQTAYLLAKPEGEFSGELERSSFNKNLLESLSVRKIVPTIKGKIVQPLKCTAIPCADDEWLPKRYFSDVASTKYQDDDKFFAALGVRQIDMPTITSRLDCLSDLTPKERSALIWGVSKYLPEQASPALLINEDNKFAKETRVFVRPSKINLPELPDWLTLYFLDDNLLDQLNIRFKTKSIRELQQKLSEFGLLEYSLSSLIEHLVADANRQKKYDKRQTKGINLELRQSVARLFQMEREGRLPDFPADLSIPLINQKNTTVGSRKIYLSHYYGVKGLILQGLYRNVDKRLLLAAPSKQGLNLEEHQIIGFMSWIGVHDQPREVTLKSVPQNFRSVVIESFQMPIRIDDYLINDITQLNRVRLEKIKTLDRLKEILSNGDFPAIVAWLATDTRIHNLQSDAADNAEVSLKIGFDRKYRYFTGTTLSHVNWIIENTPWMVNQEGSKTRPIDCVFGVTLADSAFPRPKNLPKSALSRFQLSKQHVMKGFRVAGVLSSIDDLDSDDLYRKLLQLPDSDPDGRTAQAFYTTVLRSDNLSKDDADTFRNRFLTNGRMWGEQCGTKAYYPIEDLRYVDSEGLPFELLKDLSIVALPKNLGTRKVASTFGLKVINKADLEQAVDSYIRSSDDTEDFERAKPFFCLLRPDLKALDIERLRSLELVYCTELSSTITFEKTNYQHNLNTWQWVITDTKLFVVVDPLRGAIIDFTSESIGAAIASFFGIAKGHEFALMIICRAENREELLKRMRGEAITEDLNRILQEFDQYSLAQGEIETLVDPIPDEEETDEAVSFTNEDDEEVEPSEADPGTSGNSGALEVEPRKHIPKDPKIRKPISIRKVKPGSRRARGYKLTDAQLCEDLAMEFEEIEGRFPLKVGHITGDRGYGCDILSFQTMEMRSQFKDGTSQKSDDVLKFIEVKGRKHGSVDIELKGNELKAAIAFQEKYYLYRVFELGNEEYELGILRAPLSHNEAIEETYLVDLTRAKKTKRFHLSRSDPEAIEEKVEPTKDH